MAKYNLQVFPTLEEELDTGMSLEFTQWGYMWVAYADTVLAQLQKNVDLQRSLDIPSVMMKPDEVKARWPYLCMDGIIGVAFCGDDGHINPQTLTLSYGHAARRLGATVKTYCPVVKLLAENGKIKGVVTEDGEEWHAPRVLLSAGPWSTPLAATVGVDLPVYPERHNLLITEPVKSLTVQWFSVLTTVHTSNSARMVPLCSVVMTRTNLISQNQQTAQNSLRA